MNIVKIAMCFAEGECSMLQACRRLNAIGYTRQERRRIISGVVRAQQAQHLYEQELEQDHRDEQDLRYGF